MAEPMSLPPEVASTLGGLRSRIRRYVLWEGLALVMVTLGLLFWGSFGFDTVYFVASRLELPRWLRAGFLLTAIVLVVGVVLVMIGLRTFRSFRTRALALILERRFPDLGDGLITAVEASEGTLPPAPAFQQALLERTVTDAARRLQRLDLTQVFDPRPLRRAAIVAALLFVSIVGLAVVDSAAMERWVNGYLELQPSYWPRKTWLTVKVVTQPGDRIREFQQGVYRHPRGGDLALLIEAKVADGTPRPDRIRLDYRLRGGGLKRTYLSSTGDQPYRHEFPALLEAVDLWVSGGDYANFTPLHVEVVDPPKLDKLTAAALYPAYTGLNTTDDLGKATRSEVVVQGAAVSLPLGTNFLLQGTANKPLRSVRIELDAAQERFELELGPTADGSATGARFTQRARDRQPQRRFEWAASNLLDSSGDSFSVPLLLRADGLDQLLDALQAAEQGTPLPNPLPWPADAVIRITLEDRDEIASPEPQRLTIAGIVDEPPVLEVELKGIGTAVTRQARIPVAGLIHDDYGVAKVRFEYQVDGIGEWNPRELVRPPTAIVKEYTLARTADELYERFDVLPLDLSIKQKLSLTVYAEDADDWAGPNKQRSQRYVFTIVPVEELLSLLYAKEINLRKRFEQILSEMQELRKDLDLHAERATEAEKLKAAGKPANDEALRSALLNLSACGDRSLLAIRKAATETAAVEVAFRDIRDELVNNAAETPQNMDRLETKIIGPLERINTTDFPATDQALGLFKLANDESRNPTSPLETARQELTGMIERMERILLEMKKLETYYEALELLKSIISAHDDLIEDTKNERKRNALKGLE